MASIWSPAKNATDLNIQITLDEMSNDMKQFVEQVKAVQTEDDCSQGDLYDTEEQLMNSYKFSLFDDKGETADFNDKNTRCSYLFHYGMGHILATHMVLNTLTSPHVCRGYNSWLKYHSGASLKICSIGGGPGTDIFALQSHFMWLKNEADNTRQGFGREFRIPSIDEIVILDRCLEWRETYDFLRQSLELPTATYIKFNYDKLLTEEDHREWKPILQNADFVSMIKFASSVMPRNHPEQVELAQRQLKELLMEMKDGAILLYVDTNHSFYAAKVAKVLREVNFTKLLEKTVGCEISGFDFVGIKPAARLPLNVQLWLCKRRGQDAQEAVSSQPIFRKLEFGTG